MNNVGSTAQVVLHNFWAVLYMEINMYAVVEEELSVGLVNRHLADGWLASKVVESVKEQQQNARRQNRWFWTCWRAFATSPFLPWVRLWE
jgi:dipeptide/tripeptide permease